MNKILSFTLLLCLVLSACQAAPATPSPAVVSAATNTPPAAVQPSSTATQKPTDTPPTATFTPEPTLPPSATPTETPVPTPTETPLPKVIGSSPVVKLEVRQTYGTGQIETVDFSPDGKLLAFITTTNLNLLEVDGMKLRWSLPTTRALQEIKFSADGKNLVGATKGGDVLYYDVAGGKLLRDQMKAYQGVLVAHLSDTGETLLTVDDYNYATVYDVSSNDKLAELVWQKSLFHWSGQIAPDGNSFIVISEQNKALVVQHYATSSGEVRASLRNAGRALQAGSLGQFSLDGRAFALASDKYLSIWNLDNPNKPITTLQLAEPVESFEFLPDASALMVAHDGKLERYDLSGKPTPQSFASSATAAVVHMHSSQDGALLAAVRADGLIEVWDVASAQVQQSTTTNLSRTTVEWQHTLKAADFSAIPPSAGMAMTQDGQRIARTLPDRSGIEILDVYGVVQQTIHLNHEGELTTLAYSSDGKLLASAHDDKMVLVWDVTSGELLREIDTKHRNPITQLRFNQDGSLLASLGKLQVLGWEVATGKKVFSAGGYFAMDISPDGTQIATDSADFGLYFWDLGSSRQIKLLQAGYINGLCYAPDGKTLAVSSNYFDYNGEFYANMVMVVNTSTYEWSTRILEDHRTAPVEMAYTPDGKLLAVGDMNGNLYLWDVANGRLLWSTEAVGPAPLVLRFTSDQRSLIVGSNDGVVRIFEAK